MERFREHEKEFKMKQYSKRALQADYEKKSNFVDRGGCDSDGNSRSYGSDDYSDSEGYSEQSGSDLEGAQSEEEEEEDVPQEAEADGADAFSEGGTGVDDSNLLAKDKEWLDSFIHDKLKKQIATVETEVDIIRNKKIRGASKK